MSLVGSNVEQKIWNFLIDSGLNECGAAGMMGNMYAESGLNPENLQDSFEKKLGFSNREYTLVVDNGMYDNFVRDGAGYGLCQWTFWSRKQWLLAFAKSKGKSIGDLEMQLQYLMSELKSLYPTVLGVLENATSVRQASDCVLLDFEKPANTGVSVQEKRAAYSQTYYDRYRKKGEGNVIRIGHASMSEDGSAYGAKGDSTGREVCVREWYSYPWNYMAIHPDKNVREKHAQAIEAACSNDNIGYGQGDRNTLYALAKDVDFDLSKVGPCNCDCSSLQNVAAVVSGAPGVTYGSNGWTTHDWSMKTLLTQAGYKIVMDTKYLTSPDYCVRGAIYVKAGRHTVCGLDNGPKADHTLLAAGIETVEPEEIELEPETGFIGTNYDYVGKGIGTATAQDNMNIRKGPGTDYEVLSEIELGTKVEVLETVNGWYKIVWPGCEEGYAYTSNVTGKFYSYASNKRESTSISEPSASARNFNKKIAGAYVTVDRYNLRRTPGSEGKSADDVLTVVPAGETVRCYGYYTNLKGIKWLYVVYKGFIGFISEVGVTR